MYNISLEENVNVLARYYPFLILLIIPGGYISSILLGNPSLFIYGAAIVLPPILFTTYYLTRTDRSLVDSMGQHDFIPIKFSNLCKLYLTIYVLSIVSLSIFPYRKLNYFVLISISYLLIYLGTTYENTAPYVLAGTSLNSINNSWGVLLNYPLHFGGTDILVHRIWADVIRYSGSVVSPNVTAYANYPLYHIHIAQMSIISGRSIDISLFILTGIVFTSSIPVVYLISKKMFGNSKITTITPILFSIYPPVLYYNSYVVTRVFAFIGFIFLLYITLSSDFDTVPQMILSLVVILYLILVHSVSNIQILLIFSVLYILLILTKSDSRPSLSIITIYGIAFVLYLIVISNLFFEDLLFEYILFIDGGASGISTSSSRAFQPTIQYINNYAIISTSLIGIGLGISNQNYFQPIGIAVFLFSILFSIIYLPNPLQTSELLWNTLRFDRFLLLISPFVAMTISTSVTHMAQNTHISIATIVVGILVFTSVVAVAPYPVAPDSEDLHWTGPPQHFDKSELAAFNHAKTHANGDMLSDVETSRYFRPYELLGTNEALRVDVIRENQSSESDILLRSHRISNGGIFLNRNNTKKLYTSFEEMSIMIQSRNKYYSNGNVDLYTELIV